MTSLHQLAGRRVLLIEDDYYLATDTCTALENAGATVIGPLADQQSAAALAGLQPIDCAVLDINDGNGPSFVAARAMRDYGVPILFLTGYDQAVIPAEFHDAACLQKPVRERDLIAAVESAALRPVG